MGRISWFALFVMLTVLAAEVPVEAYLGPGRRKHGASGAAWGHRSRRRTREAVLAQPYYAVSQTTVR